VVEVRGVVLVRCAGMVAFPRTSFVACAEWYTYSGSGAAERSKVESWACAALVGKQV
jgi:hypothetical protein